MIVKNWHIYFSIILFFHPCRIKMGKALQIIKEFFSFRHGTDVPRAQLKDIQKTVFITRKYTLHDVYGALRQKIFCV